MSEMKSRSACVASGCELLRYQAASQALIRLPDGRKVAILVDANTAMVHRSRGFLDLLLEVHPFGSWRLESIHNAMADSAQHAPLAVGAAILDILIRKVSRCESIHELASKASTGALDPIEDAILLLCASESKATATTPLTPS